MSGTHKQRFPLIVPDGFPEVATGMIVVFERARFTIVSASLISSPPETTAKAIDDGGAVEISGRLRPGDSIELEVDVLGERVSTTPRYLVPSAAQESAIHNRNLLGADPTSAHSLSGTTYDVCAGIREWRARLPADSITPYRLFFLRLDEWTSLPCLRPGPGRPHQLPTEIAVANPVNVLHALDKSNLVEELKYWVTELAETGVPIDLATKTGPLKHQPVDWVRAMSQYLKQVLEWAFREAFKTALVMGDGSIHEEFKLAFEQFANGQLGEMRNGRPQSPLCLPDGAFYFSFAAFAWEAKRISENDMERRFWEAVWPVWAYTAEIYRQRYAPRGGQAYLRFNWERVSRAPLNAAEIVGLRRNRVELHEFRETLRMALGVRGLSVFLYSIGRRIGTFLKPWNLKQNAS